MPDLGLLLRLFERLLGKAARIHQGLQQQTPDTEALLPVRDHLLDA